MTKRQRDSSEIDLSPAEYSRKSPSDELKFPCYDGVNRGTPADFWRGFVILLIVCGGLWLKRHGWPF